MALPELHLGEGEPDVLIRFRTVEAGEELPDSVEADGARINLRFWNIRFTVTGGTRIDIEAPEIRPSADVRIYLLGSVMAALLNQRGYLTIHANAVRTPEGAAAFAGQSGAGKSTLASWFDQQGLELLSDDLCAVRTGNGAQLFHGIPRMKLWRATLQAFDRPIEGLEQVASDMDKFHVPSRSAGGKGSLEPVPLKRVYVLDRSADGEGALIEPLSGGQAAQALLANAFRWGIGQMIMESPRAQFDQCMAVARDAAVFRVRRRWSLDCFDEDARMIERHLMAPL